MRSARADGEVGQERCLHVLLLAATSTASSQDVDHLRLIDGSAVRTTSVPRVYQSHVVHAPPTAKGPIRELELWS